MEKHIKNYLEYHGYGEQDFIPCEVCFALGLEKGKIHLRKATDVHHIVYRSHGGTNDVDNLIGVCREHHDQIHNENWPKEKVLSYKQEQKWFDKVKEKHNIQ